MSTDKVREKFEESCDELLTQEAARRIVAASGRYNNPATLGLYDMFEAGFKAGRASQSEWVNSADETPERGVKVWVMRSGGRIQNVPWELIEIKGELLWYYEDKNDDMDAFFSEFVKWAPMQPPKDTNNG